jgi:hypothetical protein
MKELAINIGHGKGGVDFLYGGTHGEDAKRSDEI